MMEGYPYQNSTYYPYSGQQLQSQGPTGNHAVERSLKRPILTTILCFAVSVALVTVVFTTPELTRYGTYTATERTIYTTIVTIIATIITSIVLAGLRFLYLQTIDDALSNSGSPALSSLPDGGTKLQSRWQTTLAISSLPDSLRNFPLYSTFLVAALVTTCITAGFTATTATRQVPYNPLISSSDPYIFARPWDTEDPSVGCTINWRLANGSFFCAWVWHGGSPQHRAFKLMDGINVNSPDLYAYADLGVAIHSSAIGAPVTLYDAQRQGYGLQELARQYDWNINSVSACAPVMVHNPVKCRPGGSITYSGDPNAPTMTLTSDDGTCSISKALTKSAKDAVYMLKHQCAHGEVGQATYIIGAANSNYARWVALGVGEVLGTWYAGQKYSIECEIDVRNGVFEYRNVTLQLSRQNLGAALGGPEKDNQSLSSIIPREIAFNRFLSSGERCQGLPADKPAITDALFATVATAPYFTTYEDGGAGWAQSLVNVISRYGDYGHPVDECGRSPPWAFPDSTNALEDVLGLIGGLAASRSVLNMSLVETTGSAEVAFLRVGPGQAFAVVYAILPLGVGWVIIGLVLRTRRLNPEWKSSKMTDLIKLGRVGWYGR